MSGSTKSGQLGLLMWKNWLLQKKKKVLTALEVVLPALFAILLFMLRGQIDPSPHSNSSHWMDFSVDTKDVSFMQLWYTPNNTVVDGMMSALGPKLNVKMKGFSTEEDLLLQIKAGDGESWVSAIVFTSDFPSDDDLPQKVTYKIRLPSDPPIHGHINWLTKYDMPETTTTGPRSEFSHGGDPGYYGQGFLTVQRALDVAIIQQFNPTAKVEDVTVRLKRHPFPPYLEDPFIFVIQNFLPLIVMLSFLILAPNICKEVVLEKEHKLKEFMKMMGLGNWQHWLTWFIKYAIFGIFTVTIMVVFLFLGAEENVAPGNSDASLIFVFLLLYCFTTILFCFAIAACFSKANSASTACGILFFVNYAPYFYLNEVYSGMEMWMKMGSALFHNIAMAYGCQIIGTYEGRGAGLKWSNMHRPIIPSDSFTMTHVLLMLLIDCVIYGTIAWYVDAVKPGPYGQPQPFLFPFMKSYWFGESASEIDQNLGEQEAMVDRGSQRHLFEANPTDEKVGIKMRNLKKVFKKGGKKVVAVDGMSLDILEGRITALLGHNGAGKTTTMHMITGFLPSTKGTVLVNGMNVRHSLDKIRSNLGLCPQENILFDTLTVTQHLTFFGRLKGIPKSEIDGQVKDMIQTLNLETKAEEESMKLSGGMKRKLCVGIALIGGSKVLILDEPTSGMDPENRRKLWDILQNHREGRTMVLSTHMMDEADHLGDRIAIMAQGQAQCYGTSLFLKSKYGVGYHMVIIKEKGCAVDNLTALITDIVPDASLEGSVGAEVTYLLPKESSSKFEELFTQLEEGKEELGVVSFGASVTTMEEVFLKVGESVHIDKETGERDEDATAATSLVTDGKVKKNTGFWKFAQQYQAMFIKRVIHSWRNRKITASQILVPVLVTVWACTASNNIPMGEDSPPLKLNLARFNDPIVPYGTENGAGALDDDLAKKYSALMKSHASGGTPYINDLADEKGMEDYLLGVAEHDFMEYVTSHMVAASFSTNETGQAKFLAYFNDEGLHTSAITLAYVGNTLLQYFTDENHQIEATNHPLPRKTDLKVQFQIDMSQIQGSVVAFNLCIGMSFLAASFVLFLIKERKSGSKHLQCVSGAHSSTFWASTFSWDLINLLIPSLLIIGVFALFDVKPHSQGEGAGYTLLIFLMFGCSVLPFVYLLSFIFKVPSTGYNWVSVIAIFTAIIAQIVVVVVKLVVSEKVGEIIEWLSFLLFPTYCFLDALSNVYVNYVVRDACRIMAKQPFLTIDMVCELSEHLNMEYSCCYDYLGWEKPGIGRQTLCMALQCLMYFGLVFLIDSGLSQLMKQGVASWLGRRRKEASNDVEAIGLMERQTSPDDSEVQEERERIANTPHKELLETDSLLLQSLKKYYGSKLAVDELSLGIPQGECFGLLGVNGAGKTTTFKMLTGEETLSSGNAWLKGYSVKSQIKQAQQSMGYCPQFDALIDQMTVKETLMLYARLRGVQESNLLQVVDDHIKKLVLEDHVNKLAAKLSGGNKRKLSTAMALIGDAPIVFLDEPTTGVDPVARRLIWDTLSAVRNSGRTLILTTHSMDECEALCTRLAIMVNGQFKCLGSTQALKSKFGQGYTLMARLSQGADLEPRLADLMRMFSETFLGCVVKDVHQGFVHYHVPGTTHTLAGIFGIMERAKEQFGIEDYSVSQTTLEQVFLGFAKAQVLPYQFSPTCITMLSRCCGKQPNVPPQPVQV